MQTSSSAPRWPYAVSGALAATAGTAAGHLVAAAVNPGASPVVAVGATVVDATPTPVKEWAVSTLGTADKPVLLTSVAVVTLLASAGIGLLARRHRTLALVLLGVLTVLAAAAALARPTSTPADVLPALAAAAVGVTVLHLLAQLADRRGERAVAPAGGTTSDGQSEPARRPVASPLDGTAHEAGARPTAARRAFLVGAAGTAAAAAAGLALGQKLGANPTLPTAANLPKPTNTLPALPTGLDRKVPGISPFRTPVGQFYRVDTSLIVPRVNPDDWALEIDGNVENPFKLSYAELLAMPMIERDITMTCVSNEVGGGYVSSARWLGVRVRDLLERARVRAGVDQVLSTSTTGFTISTPVQALTDDRDALVAVAMDGQPLPARHGFPARLVTPGLYGFVGSTKWLARLTATTYAREQAYWTERGWATDAPVLTQSRIDTPRGLDTVKAGRTIPIGGVAWAQGRGIRRVEVRVDDGEWRTATLGPDAGIDYWRQWYVPWTPSGSGRHTLTVRATDNDGQLQPQTRTDPFPKGATGWHSVVVLVG
jgi:DMSO/TMAO reductase YedYZ molybdopterin-dependent catalytic subunit